jgi:hypothetical protein
MVGTFPQTMYVWFEGLFHCFFLDLVGPLLSKRRMSMNPSKKVLYIFISFFLAMIAIACSCSSLIPTQVTPSPTPNPLPGLADTWHNPDTNDVFEIALQNGQYVVLSSTWEGTTYAITSQSWTGSSLTWSYFDSDLDLTVTLTTISISGDNLDVSYSLSDGSSGVTTLVRGAPLVTPEANEQSGNGQSSSDSMTVTSSEAGLVTSDTGVSISIPPGAVPANEDGSIGSMIFSITEDSTVVPSLPGGYIPIGPVVNLGPEGFVFEQPVMITLPIPSDVDPDTVLGATYYDPGLDEWLLVPGSVDAENRTVQVATTHLSRWSCWGYGETTGEFKDGGYFKVYRAPESTPYIGPDNRYSRAVTHHGVCIRSMVYANPTVANWWLAPTDYTIDAYNLTGSFSVAPWSDAAKYWMPYGSYELTEFYAQSEVNDDPGYLPKDWWMWRDLGTVNLGINQVLEFPVPDVIYNNPGWTLGRPPCWGMSTTSVGVGDLQVTLNWNSNADIDLHVIEPTGYEIYYGDPVSTAGGALDLDNQCANFLLGRPENIFWTNPPTGTYQVNVVYYQDCGDAGPVNFTVRICIQGVCGSPISGRVNAEDDEVSVTSFSYP